jgi:hypothetical protein
MTPQESLNEMAKAVPKAARQANKEQRKIYYGDAMANEMKRAEDVIGVNVSGTESVRLTPEQKTLMEMEKCLPKETNPTEHNDAVRNCVDRSYCGGFNHCRVGTISSLPSIRECVLREGVMISHEVATDILSFFEMKAKDDGIDMEAEAEKGDAGWWAIIELKKAIAQRDKRFGPKME